MDLKESCPSVSIPSSDEHREKKKRFTVYKVLVSVGRNEWFVFRRYAEFDKLYNTVRDHIVAFQHLRGACRQERNRLFTLSDRDRKRENSLKLKERS
uniref:PX domain-containing protein n=1 Tax=Pavo cristatus TaxID=9049 RepID=A0A8C9FWT8_PAVCR